MKDKLQVFALWAEILGGIAILVSLIFVGVQLSQSNSLATTDALREGTELWTDAYVYALGTEESTAFFARAINRCDELSMAEHGRFDEAQGLSGVHQLDLEVNRHSHHTTHAALDRKYG